MLHNIYNYFTYFNKKKKKQTSKQLQEFIYNNLVIK